MRTRRHPERAPWNTARGAANVGNYTARWLEGDIAEHPGYYGRPDDETTPLIHTLAAANWAGYITLDSQPGTHPERGFDGATWRQRAAVHGLLHPAPAADLVAKALAAGLIAVPCPESRENGLHTTATERDGQPVTWFGGGMPADYLRDQFRWCPRTVKDELCTMTQVALIDPAYGPITTLWNLLDEWATEHNPVGVDVAAYYAQRATLIDAPNPST